MSETEIIGPTQGQLAIIIENEKSEQPKWVARGWKNIARWVFEPKKYDAADVISYMKNLGFLSISTHSRWYTIWDNDPEFCTNFTGFIDNDGKTVHMFLDNEEDLTKFLLLMDV